MNNYVLKIRDCAYNLSDAVTTVKKSVESFTAQSKRNDCFQNIVQFFFDHLKSPEGQIMKQRRGIDVNTYPDHWEQALKVTCQDPFKDDERTRLTDDLNEIALVLCVQKQVYLQFLLYVTFLGSGRGSASEAKKRLLPLLHKYLFEGLVRQEAAKLQDSRQDVEVQETLLAHRGQSLQMIVAEQRSGPHDVVFLSGSPVGPWITRELPKDYWNARQPEPICATGHGSAHCRRSDCRR